MVTEWWQWLLIGFASLFASYCVLTMGLVAYATARDLKEFPKWAFIFDNKEDGFDALKRPKNGEWWSEKRGVDLYKAGGFTYWWHSWIWCSIRNPMFNSRYIDALSIDVTKCKPVSFDGNTYKKHYDGSFDRKRQKIWYKFKAAIGKKEYKVRFWQWPVSKTKSLRILIGWKIYPIFLMEERLKDFDLKAHHKDRAVWVFSIRLMTM